jgi:predicted CXXCH cytochrome family protein
MSDRLHSTHVRNDQASCLTCHDPHGVKNQTRLINFNTIYVKPFNGLLVFTDRGTGRSSCTLTCHGKAHDKASYP